MVCDLLHNYKIGVKIRFVNIESTSYVIYISIWDGASKISYKSFELYSTKVTISNKHYRNRKKSQEIDKNKQHW